MRKTFDAELQELNYEMIDMAAAAEDAIDVVTESLASGDDAAAKSAVEMTRSMDQMERDIENRCLRLLLQQQPVARDLRTISAAMKMVTDLQRIGDQCANIAEISLLLKEQKQTRTLADIRTMSQKAGVMVKRSIFAYVNRDTEAAQAVIALDDEVDALFRTIKEELVELMDELDGDARLFGAVNTVCIRDGRAYGYNTDGAGFLRALNDEGIDPAGKRVLVLGAGGAAKAVCLKLAQAGAEVVVCNRTADKAAALCAHEPARLRPAGCDPDTLRREAAECGLLVNCTSLGMEGAAGQFEEFSFLDALPAGAPVVDLIYAPAETELLRRAREGGHQTANGFGLLVNQAVLSLEHFTGTAIDAAEMKRRLADVLLP